MLVSSSVRWQWQELPDRHGSPGGIFRGFFYLIAFAMPVRRFPPPLVVTCEGFVLINQRVAIYLLQELGLSLIGEMAPCSR